MLEPAQKYNSRINLKLIPDIISGWKIIVMLFSVVILFGFIIWWLNQNQGLYGFWNGFNLDKRVPASFCEQVHLNNPVRQPLNTFSNIVYLVTAIIIFNGAWKSRQGNMPGNLTESKFFYLLFAIVLLYVFAASTFYHASLVRIAHWFDYSAVFSFSVFPVMYFIWQWQPLKKRLLLMAEGQKFEMFFLMIFTGVILALALFIPNGKEALVAMILFFLFLAAGFVTFITQKYKPGSQYLLYSVISVLVAAIWFEFDKYKIICNPKSFFQPHSLWNVFIGISAFWFYLYMRSVPFKY